FQEFLQEAAILQSMDHPNIIRFIGVLDEPNRLCIVTSWMKTELNSYLKANPGEPRKPLAHQVTEGLQYLRRHWIVHGDLKGINILVNGNGRVQIADFGSAYLVSDAEDRRSSRKWPRNAPHSRGGTYRWMAPELLSPSRFGKACSLATFESDMFAFGMLSMKIFSGGNIPFHEESGPMAVNIAILAGNRPPRPANIPDDIWNIATQCWREDPASRTDISTILI
ncbi:kinase-like domain-containing protein, partial [Mycena epipterygia]